METSGRVDTRAALLWVVMWLVGLAALVAIPAAGETLACVEAPAAATRVFEHAQASRVYQDIDGAVTVHVRGLRPVAY